MKIGKRLSTTTGAELDFVPAAAAAVAGASGRILGVDGGVTDIMAGGDAGGVMCDAGGAKIPTDGPLTNVAGSVNGKLAIELVGLSEEIGDARSEPVDMLNGGDIELIGVIGN